jgi:hypothetical protein
MRWRVSAFIQCSPSPSHWMDAYARPSRQSSDDAAAPQLGDAAIYATGMSAGSILLGRGNVLSTRATDVADFRAQWDGYWPSKIDYRWIFNEAKKEGWRNPLSKPDAAPTPAFLPNLLTAGSAKSYSMPK